MAIVNTREPSRRLQRQPHCPQLPATASSLRASQGVAPIPRREEPFMHEIERIVAIVFAIGLPLSIPIIFLALDYQKRRRLMELHHAERMAAIERGMELPPLPIEVLGWQTTTLLP